MMILRQKKNLEFFKILLVAGPLHKLGGKRNTTISVQFLDHHILIETPKDKTVYTGNGLGNKLRLTNPEQIISLHRSSIILTSVNYGKIRTLKGYCFRKISGMICFQDRCQFVSCLSPDE
jgi:hypothetical protein